jgi:hypothetical protein
MHGRCPTWQDEKQTIDRLPRDEGDHVLDRATLHCTNTSREEGGFPSSVQAQPAMCQRNPMQGVNGYVLL